jgi:DNA-binding NtrC family response regulator
VVSRWPEAAEAIEAGAGDYCAPPFEASHLARVVRAARKAGALVA